MEGPKRIKAAFPRACPNMTHAACARRRTRPTCPSRPTYGGKTRRVRFPDRNARPDCRRPRRGSEAAAVGSFTRGKSFFSCGTVAAGRFDKGTNNRPPPPGGGGGRGLASQGTRGGKPAQTRNSVPSGDGAGGDSARAIQHGVGGTVESAWCAGAALPALGREGGKGCVAAGIHVGRRGNGGKAFHADAAGGATGALSPPRARGCAPRGSEAGPPFPPSAWPKRGG